MSDPDAAARQLDDLLLEIRLLDADVGLAHARIHAAPLLRLLAADDQAVYGARVMDACSGVEAEHVRQWLEAAKAPAPIIDEAKVQAEIDRLRIGREARRRLDAEDGEISEARVWKLAELLADPSVVELPAAAVHMLAWPGRATLLAAPEKLGKSTLTGAAAAAVSAGRTWLDEATSPGAVLWAAEESPGDVARRLRRFGANPDAVAIMAWGADPVAEIRSEAARLKPALIVVDTLQGIAEHARPESGRASDWAALLRPLVRMARETGAALIILHHARRSDGAYRDSSEIAAAVDVVMTMSGSETDTLRRLSWKGRYGRGSFAVRLAGGRYELLDREDDGEAIADEILRFVAAHPGAGAKAVQRAVRGRDIDVRRTLADLLASGRLTDEGTENRRRYHLAKPAPDDGADNDSGAGSRAAAPAAPTPRRGRIRADSRARVVDRAAAPPVGGRAGAATGLAPGRTAAEDEWPMPWGDDL